MKPNIIFIIGRTLKSALFLLVSVFFVLYGTAMRSFALADIDKTETNGNTAQSPANQPNQGSLLNRLEAISSHAETIYDLASVNKWKKIEKKIIILKYIDEFIMSNKEYAKKADFLKLAKSISDLELAINEKKRLETMMRANSITVIGALLADQLKPQIPTNFAVLSYLGRELVISSETQNISKQSDIVLRMHAAWKSLIPNVIAFGGSKEVKKIAEIFRRLDNAKTSEEYGHLARHFINELASLEKIFTK